MSSIVVWMVRAAARRPLLMVCVDADGGKCDRCALTPANTHMMVAMIMTVRSWVSSSTNILNLTVIIL